MSFGQGWLRPSRGELRGFDYPQNHLRRCRRKTRVYVYVKELVGANGFEPSTSWPRTRCINTILLARMALFCVEHARLGRYSAAKGLRSDPSQSTETVTLGRDPNHTEVENCF